MGITYLYLAFSYIFMFGFIQSNKRSIDIYGIIILLFGPITMPFVMGLNSFEK